MAHTLYSRYFWLMFLVVGFLWSNFLPLDNGDAITGTNLWYLNGIITYDVNAAINYGCEGSSICNTPMIPLPLVDVPLTMQYKGLKIGLMEFSITTTNSELQAESGLLPNGTLSFINSENGTIVSKDWLSQSNSVDQFCCNFGSGNWSGTFHAMDNFHIGLTTDISFNFALNYLAYRGERYYSVAEGPENFNIAINGDITNIPAWKLVVPDFIIDGNTSKLIFSHIWLLLSATTGLKLAANFNYVEQVLNNNTWWTVYQNHQSLTLTNIQNLNTALLLNRSSTFSGGILGLNNIVVGTLLLGISSIPIYIIVRVLITKVKIHKFN